MTDQRELDIQTLCEAVKDLHAESTGDYGSGAQCPFCREECPWNAGSLETIEHKPDCVVLIAKDLSTNIKL